MNEPFLFVYNSYINHEKFDPRDLHYVDWCVLKVIGGGDSILSSPRYSTKGSDIDVICGFYWKLDFTFSQKKSSIEHP